MLETSQWASRLTVFVTVRAISAFCVDSVLEAFSASWSARITGCEVTATMLASCARWVRVAGCQPYLAKVPPQLVGEAVVVGEVHAVGAAVALVAPDPRHEIVAVATQGFNGPAGHRDPRVLAQAQTHVKAHGQSTPCK